MLPKQYRLRDREQYDLVVRRGKRAGNRYLVIHHLTGQFGTEVPLVGFVVSKKQVPLAVNRNRVKRRLRAILWQRRNQLPKDLALVVRVNGLAAGASLEILEKNLFLLLRRQGVVADAN